MKTNDDDTFGSTDRDKMTQDDQNSRAVNKGDLVSKDQGFERVRCSIPDDHIDPRRFAFFMARSVLRDIRSGVRTC